MAELKRTAPHRQQRSLFGHHDKLIATDFVVEDGKYILIIGEYEVHMSRAETDILHKKIHSEIDGNVGALKARRTRVSKKGNQEEVERYDTKIAKAIEETKRKTRVDSRGSILVHRMAGIGASCP